MSWNAPQNWNEILFSVERGFSCNARKHGISTDHVAVCSNDRRTYHGFPDKFSETMLNGCDALHRDYMCGYNRAEAWHSDTPLYYVMRDGNILAYVDRGGEIHVNPAIEHIGLNLAIDRNPKRYRDALSRVLPALERYADKVSTVPREEWL